MKALLIDIEISDKMGTSKTELVGIFDNDHDINEAKEKLDSLFYRNRTFYKEIEVTLNKLREIGWKV